VQNILFLNLLSKNNEIKLYRTIIVSLVLYGFENWSITFREEQKLRMIKNRTLSRILGIRGKR